MRYSIIQKWAKKSDFYRKLFFANKKLISIIDRYLLRLIEQTFDLHFQCIIFPPICSDWT